MGKREPDRCARWPQCVCHDKMSFYATAPAEAYEHEGAEVILLATMACASQRCPDAGVRRHATVQLMKMLALSNRSERRSIQ